MKVTTKLIVAMILAYFATASNAMASDAMIKEGEKIFNTKKIGNCLACHDANGKKINNPGALGPKLTGLKYWDDKDLYNIIYEPYSTRSKINAMPSFGKNGVLTDHQIKAVVAYLKTIE